MRLRDLREDNDITQNQIALMLNIKQNTYSQYENGKRGRKMKISLMNNAIGSDIQGQKKR